MLPPVSEERRNELHKKFALWIVNNNRPLTIGEHDVELRDIFHYILQVAIFGILAYWLTPDFVYVEKLLAAIPFGEVRHTAREMELATKRASADIGIGVFVESEDGDIVEDTVVESIHASASDSASNIVKGWQVFDGHECSCHTLALSVGTYMESEGVKSVFVKLRGISKRPL
ncbi:hypothetical protein CYMTET_51750 [Cymbomonas tetramitiformis]|uniref:Uncharacterized protein n=1 Tax=Cymbomonas tetramitiformis TaxID=36881 RepID=A0AAE0ETD4_9CHLO|nr:hypothetical protein CYMTET_51750 [Cymbomonas tetramitiformis]